MNVWFEVPGGEDVTPSHYHSQVIFAAEKSIIVKH